jgi:hypothetical protein
MENSIQVSVGVGRLMTRWLNSLGLTHMSASGRSNILDPRSGFWSQTLTASPSSSGGGTSESSAQHR